MVAPGGSVAIFHNYTWHAAAVYTRPSGQRYVWKFAFGRAYQYWEGTAHYTLAGGDPHFRDFIGGLSARDRELFRFPPPAILLHGSDAAGAGGTVPGLELRRRIQARLMPDPTATVGVIANPLAATDIRRVTANAGFPSGWDETRVRRLLEPL